MDESDIVQKDLKDLTKSIIQGEPILNRNASAEKQKNIDNTTRLTQITINNDKITGAIQKEDKSAVSNTMIFDDETIINDEDDEQLVITKT